MRGRLAAALLGVTVLACGPRVAGGPVVRLLVTVEPTSQLDLQALTLDPAPAARVDVSPSKVELVLPAGVTTATLRHPEGCTTRFTIDPAKVTAGGWLPIAFKPLIELTDDQPQLGFDAPFEIAAHPGCPEASQGKITWARVGSTDIPYTVEANGFVVRGRTPTLAVARPGPLPAQGILSFSPTTRGELLLEASLVVEGRTVRRRASVAAAARATGVPTVGLGHEVWLTGAGWAIKSPALGGKATLVPRGDLTAFTPDASGHWILTRDGKELTLQAGRADEMPLDCTRSDCHASVGNEITGNKMATVLLRGLEGGLGEAYDPRCAIACHTAGEPGIADGGFAHVAREEHATLPLAKGKDAWGRLPRSLRRIGGVGCVACHGPAAIPAPAARWSILRADVCAVCHDAPPRYGHVAAWRSSRMARSDARPETREGACAGCHTTHGYLAARGFREIKDESIPPAEAAPVGIACTACHANHGQHQDVALLRKVPAPASLGEVPAQVAGGKAQVCLHCHAPTADGGSPEAGAAALWLGRGGLEVATGAPIIGPAAHAALPDGCVGCHRTTPTEVVGERGRNHGFRSDPKACASCHPGGPFAEKIEGTRSIRVRADALVAKLRARGLVRAAKDLPPHAGPVKLAADTPLGRAARNVLLVAEDPAAAWHNAAYARRLLDEAETLLR